MSDAPVIKGSEDMTLVRSGNRWNKEDGQQIVQYWEGPRTVAKDFWAAYVNEETVDEAQHDERGGKGYVTLVYNAVEDDEGGPMGEDNSVWEVLPNEMVKDIRTHPYFNPSASVYQYITEADQSLARGEQYDYDGMPSFNEMMQRYLGLRLAGVEGYVFSGVILKKSTKTSNIGTLTASWKNVNFVVNLNVDIDPPIEVIGSINELERCAEGEMGDGLREDAEWEWLKKAPVVRTAGSPRLFQIDEQWWGADKWSKVFYGGSFDPMATW